MVANFHFHVHAYRDKQSQAKIIRIKGQKKGNWKKENDANNI
jgi:hypothetical protein